MDYKHLKMKY